jgi:hypothetical protein
MELVGITAADVQILERLFTMKDVAGSGRLPCRELVCSFAPLFSGTAEDKLKREQLKIPSMIITL